jgi:hypothetical protein
MAHGRGRGRVRPDDPAVEEADGAEGGGDSSPVSAAMQPVSRGQLAEPGLHAGADDFGDGGERVQGAEEDGEIANAAGLVEVEHVESLGGSIADRGVEQQDGCRRVDDLARRPQRADVLAPAADPRRRAPAQLRC